MSNISIIIPTFNRAHLITRAIGSVLMQSFDDWELVIVDDGSTDDTDEVVSQFLSDSRILYIKKENTGAAHSRNIGVKHAKSDLVTFLDSDDEVDPGWLEKVISPFSDRSIAVVCCGLTVYNSMGKVINKAYPRINGMLYFNQKGLFSNGGVFIVRKDIFDIIGGYDSSLKANQHTELAIRLIPYIINNGYKIYSLDEHLVNIHVHDGERIRFNHKSVFEGNKRVLQLHEKHIRKDRKFYRGILATTVYTGLRSGEKSATKRYAMKLLKNYPFELRSWYYALRCL